MLGLKQIIQFLLIRLRGSININSLINKGFRVGENFNCQSGCVIDQSHCFHITIGENVTLAPQVRILAHDASTRHFLGYTKVGNVRIGNNVFVGTGSILLPGIEIGNNVVIGAGSVVTKDIPSNSVAFGSPAKVMMSLDAYLEKEKQNMKNSCCFNEKYTFRNQDFDNKMKEELKSACDKHKIIYLK